MPAKLRIKCPSCGNVENVHPGHEVCPRCQTPADTLNQGSIYLYRQGSPFGIAGGFGIYINGEPYGHIGNKELLCLPLKFGTYVIHCAAGMNRKCRDLQVTITPECPVAYTKVYMKAGFATNSFVVEPLDPKLLDL